MKFNYDLLIMELVYYTVGFNPKYIDMLYLSIVSLRKYNTQDILIICDEALVETCIEKVKNIKRVTVVACKDSINAMDSSMKKLLIFDYDISKYKKILFVDSDILVDVRLHTVLPNVVDDGIIYAFPETRNFMFHLEKYHSLMDYTVETFKFLVDNKIYPFNCGLFAFLNTPKMKEHFQNIRDMIDNYQGSNYHYEQSFMNVYFNTRKLANTLVFTEKNCIMNIDIEKVKPKYSWLNADAHYRNKFFHFCYQRDPDKKIKEMLLWINMFKI